MASILDSLPFTVERIYDTLVSPADSGCVLARTRSPGLRRFRLVAENLDLLTEVAPIIAAIEAFPGASMPFPVTLPDVGTINVRNDEDGWSYQVANGKLRHLSLTLIEEP